MAKKKAMKAEKKDEERVSKINPPQPLRPEQQEICVGIYENLYGLVRTATTRDSFEALVFLGVSGGFFGEVCKAVVKTREEPPGIKNSPELDQMLGVVTGSCLEDSNRYSKTDMVLDNLRQLFSSFE